MKLEACLAGNRSSGSGIDSATKKQDSIFACHVRRLDWNTHVKMPRRNVTPFLALGNFCPFHWVTFLFFVSSRRRHTSSLRDWSSDVCSSDLVRRDGTRPHRLIPGHEGENASRRT